MIQKVLKRFFSKNPQIPRKGRGCSENFCCCCRWGSFGLGRTDDNWTTFFNLGHLELPGHGSLRYKEVGKGPRQTLENKLISIT